MSDVPQDVESTETFEAELETLLRRAHAGGVDLPGGWECRDDADYPDWDVVITELSKQSGSD